MNNNFNLSQTQPQQQTGSNMKYKTILCKHYDTSKGCVYKDKCQFAHGLHELRNGGGFNSGNNFSTQSNNSFQQQGLQGQQGQQKDDGMGQNQKKVPNPANFKIVKCKNFDREGQCKYGNTCTFAHGETDLRSKSENIMSPNLGGNMMMNPMMMNPYMMDPNLLFYMQSQMGGYPMNADPNMAQQQGNFGAVDPNALNLNNSSPSNQQTNGFNPEMAQNFNMNSMYGMYPGQGNMN